MAHRNKGKRIEHKCRLLLEKDGYKTIQVIQTKWCKKDFWELFDVIGKKKDFMIYVQVKTNNIDKNVINQIREFKNNYGNINESYEYWNYTDRKGFERIKIE